MGYDLHITRKEDWYDEEPNNDISLEEWLAYIHSAGSELELSDASWVKVPGSETESQVVPGFCKWTAHPSDERPYFDYFRGSISTKNPDDPTTRKMLSMASQLNAKVQGDDGEVYGLSADNEIIYRHIEVANTNKRKKAWWKFW